MTARASFLLRHLGPALAAVAFLLILELTGIDSAISNGFYDPAAGA